MRIGEANVLYRVRKNVARRIFDLQIRRILKTQPVEVVEGPLTIVTMVAKSDVLMYLLSMKSFYRAIGFGKIVAIIDRDMPDLGHRLLEEHFPGIRLVVLEDIDPGPCQRGGTWERLVYVVALSEQDYVIQIDCDTLSIGNDLGEVMECINNNIAFAYADNNWSIKSLLDYSRESAEIKSNYVGIVLEQAFATWADSETLKYVRASSGFAGFAKGGASIDLLHWFHAQMRQSLLHRWRDWGTEQSGSNFIIANTTGAVTLPYPSYATFPLPTANERAKFFHFIGSNRFDDWFFARQGRRIIELLLAEQA